MKGATWLRLKRRRCHIPTPWTWSSPGSRSRLAWWWPEDLELSSRGEPKGAGKSTCLKSHLCAVPYIDCCLFFHFGKVDGTCHINKRHDFIVRVHEYGICRHYATNSAHSHASIRISQQNHRFWQQFLDLSIVLLHFACTRHGSESLSLKFSEVSPPRPSDIHWNSSPLVPTHPNTYWEGT